MKIDNIKLTLPDAPRDGHKKRHSMSPAYKNNVSPFLAKCSFELLYIYILFPLSQRGSQFKDISALISLA